MNKEINFSFGIEFPEDDAYARRRNRSLHIWTESSEHKKERRQNTKKKDVTDMNTFVRFCCTISERRSIEDIPEHELDNILCQFFMKATTQKGKLYDPDWHQKFFAKSSD